MIERNRINKRNKRIHIGILTNYIDL